VDEWKPLLPVLLLAHAGAVAGHADARAGAAAPARAAGVGGAARRARVELLQGCDGFIIALL